MAPLLASVTAALDISYTRLVNMSAPLTVADRWRLRASDFELLFEGGALADLHRAELIDGDIYSMSPQLTRHARAKTNLGFAIRSALVACRSDLQVVVEVSVVAANDSVPEPDVVVTSYTGDRFMPAETVVLAVEVADTTLSTDLGRKAELYAAAGIPEYWVVDVNEGRIMVQWAPASGAYGQRHEVRFGETLASRTIPGLEVGTAGLIG